MKIFFNFLLLLITAVSSTFAQDEYEQIQKVTANSGLILRTAPNTNSSKIITIPYNTMILTLGESYMREETINGVKGVWYKTYYKGEYGYVFGGYLSDNVDYDASRNVLEAYQVVYDMGKGKLPLMSAPSEKSEEIYFLGEGSVVYVLEPQKLAQFIRQEKNGWLKVRFQEHVGYFHSDNLISYEAYPLYLEAKTFQGN